MELQGHLRRLGVWHFTDSMSLVQAEEFVGRIEQLGYSALWLPDTVGRDPFAHIAHLARTESLVFATGIASIFHRHPGAMKQAANTLAEQTDGRFVLGLGVSHGPMVEGLRRLDYSKPLSQMRDYLAAMDASPYSATPPEKPPTRLLAALGPKMTELAGREAADGAHPYWTTPEHTAHTRQILGPDKLLCVEQKVVLATDPSIARELAKQALGTYSDLPNYRNNWKRLGFSDDEIDRREPRFIDAVVAWGDADAIGVRLMAHYDAGATHVCIQPLSPDGFGRVDWSCLEALAPAG